MSVVLHTGQLCALTGMLIFTIGYVYGVGWIGWGFIFVATPLRSADLLSAMSRVSHDTVILMMRDMWLGHVICFSYDIRMVITLCMWPNMRTYISSLTCLSGSGAHRHEHTSLSLLGHVPGYVAVLPWGHVLPPGMHWCSVH